MRVVRLLMLGVLFVATALCFDLAWNAAQDMNETLLRQRWEHRVLTVRVPRANPAADTPQPTFEFPVLDLVASGELETAEPEEAAPPPKTVRVPKRPRLKGPEAAPVVDSTLVEPEDAIRMALRRKRPAFEHCYNQELKKQAAFDGFLVVALSLSADGRVTEAHLEEGTRRDAQVGACILAQLRLLQLPPLTEEADLIIPIRLEAKKPT